MTTNIQKIIKMANSDVNFQVKDMVNDTVVQVDFSQVTPTLIPSFISNSGGLYWSAQSLRGHDCLCSNIADGTDVVLTIELPNGSRYLTSAQDFVGGHPVHRPVGF